MALKVLKSKKRKRNSRFGNFDYIDYIIVLDYNTELTYYQGKMQAVVSDWVLYEDGVKARGCGMDEMMKMLDAFNATLGEKSCYRAKIFVRNLSYFFQFAKAFHDFSKEDVMAATEHKIINCSMGKLDFRCLTYHSNMRMKEYCAKYSSFPFDEDDLENRSHSMRSAIMNEMEIEKDDLYSVPDTATGYVRRDTYASLSSYNSRTQTNYHLDKDTYLLLDNALRGGNCVASRFCTGNILSNVKSVDRCSAYTDSILNHEFPMGKWQVVSECDWHDVERAKKRRKAVVMQVKFEEIELKNEYDPAPYLSTRHCEYGHAEVESGRILSSDSLTTIITDIDFDIIQKQYKWKDATVLRMSMSKYGKLPENLLEVQRDYYRKKTELKEVEGQEFYYIKNKAKNNSIAGIFQQRPIQRKFSLSGSSFVEQEVDFDNALTEANKNARVSFAWGVWATAWARWELQKGIDAVGLGFCYSDTDSIKYIGDFDWTEINKEKEQESKANGGYAKDKHGKTHYVGVWEEEKTATKFCVLGQKKYASCYDDSDDVVITVSGLDKELGSDAINKGDEYGHGIERFKLAEHVPFVFKDSAGGVVIYNDFDEPVYDSDGTKITSNVVIKPAVFTLGGKDIDTKVLLATGRLCWVSE